MLVNIPYIEHMGNGFINQLITGQSHLVLARCYRLARERCLLVDVSLGEFDWTSGNQTSYWGF